MQLINKKEGRLWHEISKGIRVKGVFGGERADFMDILYFPELGFEVGVEKKYLAADVMGVLVVPAATCNKAIIKLQVLGGFRHRAYGG